MFWKQIKTKTKVLEKIIKQLEKSNIVSIKITNNIAEQDETNELIIERFSNNLFNLEIAEKLSKSLTGIIDKRTSYFKHNKLVLNFNYIDHTKTDKLLVKKYAEDYIFNLKEFGFDNNKQKTITFNLKQFEDFLSNIDESFNCTKYQERYSIDYHLKKNGEVYTECEVSDDLPYLNLARFKIKGDIEEMEEDDIRFLKNNEIYIVGFDQGTISTYEKIIRIINDFKEEQEIDMSEDSTDKKLVNFLEELIKKLEKALKRYRDEK